LQGSKSRTPSAPRRAAGQDRDVRLLELLEALARAANEAASPEEAMRICLERISGYAGWTLGRVAVLETDASVPRIESSLWLGQEVDRFAEFVRVSENYDYSVRPAGKFVSLVLREKRALWVENFSSLHPTGRLVAAVRAGLHSGFVFPVIVQRKVAAFLEFFAEEPRRPDKLLLDAIESVGAQLARLVERGRADALRAQLAAIVESSQDAIVGTAPDRAIFTWNTGAERLFGYTRAEAVGRDVAFLVPEDRRQEVGQRRAIAMTGVQAPPHETERLAKNGRRVPVSISASPLKDSGGNVMGVALIYRDISERKRAEIERGRLAAIVESSNDAIISRDLEHRIVTWNAAAERLFGYTAEEAIGRDVSLIISPDQEAEVARRRARLASGQSVPTYEAVRLTKDGRRIDLSISQFPIKDSSDKLVGVSSMFRDISERLQREQALRDQAHELRRLSRRLLEAEEVERRRLARELHDRVGQNVTALNLNLNLLRAALSPDSVQKAGAYLDDCDSLLATTGQLIRNVMADLRPPGLDELGLAAALAGHARQAAARSGFSVVVTGAERTPRLPPEAEIALFRVAQEALTNIAKHARATEVTISFEPGPEKLIMVVSDNGSGFDPAAPPLSYDTPHLGLPSMRERAESVGARLRVESSIGRGTRVIVEASRGPVTQARVPRAPEAGPA
jgi:PAS domain S-box-containing protein